VRPWAVHLNGYAHGVLPFRAPAVVVGHSCVASWDEAVGGTWTPAALAAYRQSAGAGLRAAAWVVAPTAAMLAALQRHYGPLERASVIPNGRDAARFVVGPKEPFVLAAGRLWDRAKNVDAVRRIAKRLSWRVMIAGDRSIGVGRLSEPELRDCLARAAIFALPARYEPFGLLPLEAALSGCALVLGDIASLREVWGDAAVYVEPDNDRALAGAIESLIACPDCLGECASAARHRAAVYTPAAMADGYVALYQAVQPQPVVRRPRAWATTGVVRCAS
jgi:glycosyltransferase involved in cell wall biosynthesis